MVFAAKLLQVIGFRKPVLKPVTTKMRTVKWHLNQKHI